MNPNHHYHYQQLLHPHQQPQTQQQAVAAATAASMYQNSYIGMTAAAAANSYMQPTTGSYGGAQSAMAAAVSAASQPTSVYGSGVPPPTTQPTPSRMPVTSGAIWNPMNPTPSSNIGVNHTPLTTPSSTLDMSVTPMDVDPLPSHHHAHVSQPTTNSGHEMAIVHSDQDSAQKLHQQNSQKQGQHPSQAHQKQRPTLRPQHHQQRPPYVQAPSQSQSSHSQQLPHQQSQAQVTTQPSQSQPTQQQAPSQPGSTAIKEETQSQSNPPLHQLPQDPQTGSEDPEQQLQVGAIGGPGVTGMPTSTNPDTNICYASLLGMAETFRTMSPPNMRLCLHCLKAILTYKLPVNLEARTHLQIGKILFQHSRNDDQIKFYLEKARALAANLRPPDDVIKFEADDLLADFFERLGERYDSINVLNDSVSISTNNPYWQCRALLKLAQANVAERDIHAACDILAMGAEFAQIHNSDYTRGLFLLSKCMLLLTNRQLSDVNNTMTVAKHLIDNLNGGTPYQKEALRIFYLIVTVSHTLIVGQNKSARPNLRLLHQAIQQFAAMDEDMMRTREVDQFQWLPREQMVVLVYLITAMHSMQWGSIDKALKYTDKALTQIEKLSLLDSSPILTIFQLSTLEHIVMCRLVSGNKTNAVQVIGHLCRQCMANPRLMHRRGPQLHTLLGLYAMSMNCMDNADAQFHMALKLSAQQSAGDPTTDPLTIFIVLNLALVCLRQGKTADCHDLLAAIKADSLPVDSHYSLRASAYFVKGLAALFAGKYHEARGLLRETLKMANQEDLHRLIACSLVVLGQTFMNMGNLTEAQNMLKPAIRVANCIPDISVQLWSASLLKDMYSLLANRGEEENWKNMHGHYSQSVISDHIDASSQQEHQLINWLEGPLPDVGSGGSGSGGSGHPPSSSSSAGHPLVGAEEDAEVQSSSTPLPVSSRG